MNKKILNTIFFISIAIAASYNYTQNKNVVELSDLALENIEALAMDEYLLLDCESCPGAWCYRAIITPDGNWAEAHPDYTNRN